jgi:hypothetical protein
MDGLTLLDEALRAQLNVVIEGDQLKVRGPKSAEPLARMLLARKAEIYPLVKAKALDVLAEADDGTTTRQKQAQPTGGLGRSGGQPGEDEDWPLKCTFPIDWVQEWNHERAILRQRSKNCQDPAIVQRLLDLAEEAVRSKEEFLAWGARLHDLEHDLRQEGKLPSYPWSGRDSDMAVEAEPAQAARPAAQPERKLLVSDSAQLPAKVPESSIEGFVTDPQDEKPSP